MGYDQYWLAVPELPRPEWDAAVRDFAAVSNALHGAGLRLAGPDGAGHPVMNGETIAFNGVRDCGHAARGAGGRVQWPDKDATGVAGGTGAVAPAAAAAAGGSGSGSGAVLAMVRYVPARICDGSCAADPFTLSRTMPDDDYTKVHGKTSVVVVNGRQRRNPAEWVGKYFARCRTCYKPYDLAVCCALLVAKRRFGALVAVCSDGTNANWADARSVCQGILGYGRDMVFSARTGRMVCARGARTPRRPEPHGRHVPEYSPDGDALRLRTARIPAWLAAALGGGGIGGGEGGSDGPV